MLTTAKWTIADYHSMVAAGILAGRQVELLQGEIVEMPPEPHAYASDEAAEYMMYLLGWAIGLKSGKASPLIGNRNQILQWCSVWDENIENIIPMRKIFYG